MDLIFLSNPHLNSSKYALTTIDIFTRKASVVLIKDKKAETVIEAMLQAFKDLGAKPNSIYADEGSEFIGGQTKEFLDEMKIKLITTFSHAPYIERFNRTLKEMMEKYLNSTKSKAISQVIPKIVNNYNNSYHSVIGMSPNQVNEANMHIVQENILRRQKFKRTEPIQIGDTVRIQLKDNKLRKGYKPKFSTRVYEISEIKDPYYIVKGDNRKYLKAHLQKVSGVEQNENAPQNDLTREGQLNRARQAKRETQFTEEILPELNIVERPKRQIKKIKKLDL
jgi:hypothetical protein